MIVTVSGATEIIHKPSEVVEPDAMNLHRPSVLVQLMKRCNSFFVDGLVSTQGECRPFYVGGRQIGLIRPDILPYLLNYPQVFTNSHDALVLNPQLTTYAARSNALDFVLRDLRAKNVLIALRGWREECFDVWADFGTETLFKMERSAFTLFGIRAYGVHINGFSRAPDGSMIYWLQKRAIDKPTYPGMMDTMVGGGITSGLKPSQVLYKEAHEEAGIPEHIIKTARPAGTISFLVETQRGLHANTEFVYDLELPNDFIPRNNDGEVEGFEAIPVEELLERVISSKYKLTSCPVAIDFLIRHGYINSDTEPQLPRLMELLHVPLNQLYIRWPHTVTPMASSPTPPPSDM